MKSKGLAVTIMMNSEISKYTISVYELIEANFDFGLDKYEIFDENYRETLNNSILNYYMFREIGYINPIVWRQRLKNRMDIIMRNKYNALYKAKLMEFNPLYTMELYEDYTHTIKNSGSTSSIGELNYTTNSINNTTNNESSDATINDSNTTNSESLNLTSQFPSSEMMESDLSTNLYVDGATKVKGNTTINDTTTNNTTLNGSLNSTINGTDKTTNNNNGKSDNEMSESFSKKTIGSASDLTFAHAMTQFKEYCEEFNLDQMIIDDLKDLFMQVW